MPDAAPHSCSAPGCSAIVPAGVRACSAHAASRWREQDERRLSPSLRGYDRAWYRFLAAYRLGAGLDTTRPDYHLHLDARNRCAVCGTRYGLEFDHIIPLSRGGARLDPDNVQPLCHRHHSEKTRRETDEAQVAGVVQRPLMVARSKAFAF